MHGPNDRDTVELWMPAANAYVPLARLEAATIASLLDCTVDEVDDLRLAVEELCLWALRQPRTNRGRLCLSLRWDDSLIEGECVLRDDGVAIEDGAVQPDALLDTLSVQILAALVDEHGFSQDHGEPRAWLRKKRST